MNAPRFRSDLLRWYDAHRRDLPWRRTSDPWHILVSEFMLQQTRVETVIPYYTRFLSQFPTAAHFASAAERQVLTAWAGLGYYTRARNLHKAAHRIHCLGAFPANYHQVRDLPGVGDYTAAAVSSIAFNLPHAALDGNIARVLARVANDDGDIKNVKTRARLQTFAGTLLHPARPGDFNQALMELGATVCIPRNPKCPLCPVQRCCEARRHGRERELPIRLATAEKRQVELTLLLILRNGDLLLKQREADKKRLAGFWELPDAVTLKYASVGPVVGRFKHTIVNTYFNITVRTATVAQVSDGFQWWPLARLHEIPLTTAAKKAVPCLEKNGSYR